MPGRYAWLQVFRGRVSDASESLQARGGALVGIESIKIIGSPDGGEVLLFDLACH